MSEPDFFDSALHSEPPQTNVLRLLQDLSEAWQPIRSLTDGDDMAIGILLLADGIQVRGTREFATARLTAAAPAGTTSCGRTRTKRLRRGAVLTFVWDQYREHKAREYRVEGWRDCPPNRGRRPCTPGPRPPPSCCPSHYRPGRKPSGNPRPRSRLLRHAPQSPSESRATSRRSAERKCPASR